MRNYLFDTPLLPKQLLQIEVIAVVPELHVFFESQRPLSKMSHIQVHRSFY